MGRSAGLFVVDSAGSVCVCGGVGWGLLVSACRFE